MTTDIQPINESDYNEILQQAVAVIDKARSTAVKSVCSTANLAYWSIGKMLHERKVDGRYGDGIVKRLSVDLKQRYPTMGLSPRNLWNMKRFYLRFSDCDEKLQRSVAVLQWTHILILISKELDVELGNGFTFIGNQYVVTYEGRESRIDLLFFHRQLKCLVAFELKIGKFKPEYIGKMNYYLSILDRTERCEDENPSIGIILCAEKDHVDVELALEGVTKPIGVANYQLILPKEDLIKVVQDEIDYYVKDSETTLSRKTKTL